MFDVNPRLIGLVVRGIEIRGVEELEKFIVEERCPDRSPDLIPKDQSARDRDRLVRPESRQSGILPIRIYRFG